MRSSISIRSCACGLVAVTAAMLTASLGMPALGGDDFSDSLVAGLAGLADLEPVAAVDDVSIDVVPVEPQAARAKSFARQSVPARDRAVSYRDGELFRNSKAALPLLVADLEPQAAASIRPLSGRSVGARPAAAWTRPTTPALSVEPRTDSPKRPSAAWSSFGQR
ncbi:MAG: hypothetical protein ACKOCX_10200 [Planctomycetota bacterium]